MPTVAVYHEEKGKQAELVASAKGGSFSVCGEEIKMTKDGLYDLDREQVRTLNAHGYVCVPALAKKE